MKNMYDAIIVGAGTAGTFLAYLLSKKDLNVLVIDKDNEDTIRSNLDIIHFPSHAYDDFNITRSMPGDDDYVKEFHETRSRSALNNYEKHNKLDVHVLHLNKFIKKLRGMITSSNVEFMFNTTVFDLLYDQNNEINGVILAQNEVLYAKLVVDASGIDSILRRKISSDYMESFEIDSMKRFYVLLYYAKFKDPSNVVKLSTSWTYYKCWIAPNDSGDGGIIGCGATTSVEYLRKCMDRFLTSIEVPEFTVEKEEIASTPYTRNPYSFVDNHFLAIGDVGALTNPMNGEGIMWNFYFLRDIIDVLYKAFEKDDLSLDSLWDINVIYQRTRGRNDAYTRCAMKGVMDNTKKDNDYLFKNNVIFKSDDDPEPNMVKVLLKGVFTGKFKLSSFYHIVYQASIANKLKKLYENYPETKDGYHKFTKKADRLWKRAGSISDLDK